ncbi:bifunctional DNA-formamidopyrimidine glycosylase/DNA-(apurinic or apyrimidinic site) lyase [Paludibaculum fermentans]|uniref:bifunctional DNA-formamidopyrimidine glycosylase/DNA-(apurinic or apyrimidinic site) lyase n=1 Tax=Paludibaculum fermentans TaxID=1473598 RepID=UPI003EB75000
MPELPEVEAVTRKMRAAAPWSEIVATGQFRPTTALDLERAVGRRLEGVTRRGKHILLTLADGPVVRVHLKMTGNLVVIPDVRLRTANVRAWLTLSDGRGIVLEDPRALGRLTYHEGIEGLFDDLGPEPFSAEFTAQHFVAQAQATKKPVKLLLMEQRAVVGLGNIYAAEALFQAGIHPAKPANEISVVRLKRLHGQIVDVLTAALDSAIAAYEQPGGFTEGENFPVAVYGREGEACWRCQAAIRRMPQGGRSTYYCPKCQR